MRTIGILVFALPMQFGVAGCRPDAQTSDGTSRDSAGIAIVENSSPRWSEDDRWRIGDAPLVAIGVLDGDPRYQFERISQVIRLRDGRVIVTDAQREMRYFDSAGRHLLTVGGAGSGPGEFRQLWAPYQLAPDSLVLLDIANRRCSVYDSSGVFIRDFPFEQRLTFPTGMAMLSDRTGIGVEELPWERITEGVSRPVLSLIRFALEGGDVDTIARLPGGGWFRSGGSFWGMPFGPSLLIGARDTVIWVVVGDTAQLRNLGPDGRVRRVARLNRARRPVTPELVSTWRARRQGMRRESSRPQPEPPLPDSLPHFSRLVIGTDHHVWVRRYTTDWERSEVWDVFTPQGEWLGELEIPAPFRMTHADAGHVAGVWRDTDDVDYARVYALIKPDSKGR